MKDQELKKLAKGLGRALKLKKYVVPHSVLLHAVAAIAGETNWHVVTANAKPTEVPETKTSSNIPVLKLGDPALSTNALMRMEAAEDIRAIVEMELNTLLEGDFEGFLDELSERITGSIAGLSDISYRVVHPTAEGDLALSVYQNLTDWKPDQLKAYGLNALLEDATTVLDRPKGFSGTSDTVMLEVTAAMLEWNDGGIEDEDSDTNGIPAECHSDDRVFEVSFDAAPWFARATDQEILRLANCGFGGDYPADEVSMSMAGRNADLKELHKYVERVHGKGRDCGYECHVDSAAALAWIKQHRPVLLDQIETRD
jgi:hypothetical protein